MVPTPIMEHPRTLIQLFEEVESLGWLLSEGETGFFLQKRSEQVNEKEYFLEGKTALELIQSIYNTYDDFDVSTETMKYLDETGHGMIGYPDDMKEVYQVMETKKEDLWELFNYLTE